ncbi:MAG: tetratricopeptide repeat protein, partial [Bacteroidota bacterium]
ENRFTAVNKDFFERLKHQFPNLQPYDLKICALIKLNFSGKEMARLLGITPESANTSRYRLRKRLGLKKEENLVTFIDSV